MKATKSWELAEQVVVLTIGRLNLVFPQREIRTLEPVLDLDAGEFALSIGDIVLDEGNWPIFALTEDLELVARPPEKGRVCVLMSHDRWRFGLLCDKVANAPASNIRAQPLPECMHVQGSVVHSLSVADGKIMSLTHAESVWRYLQRLGCTFAEGDSLDQPELTDLTASIILKSASF